MNASSLPVYVDRKSHNSLCAHVGNRLGTKTGDSAVQSKRTPGKESWLLLIASSRLILREHSQLRD